MVFYVKLVHIHKHVPMIIFTLQKLLPVSDIIKKCLKMSLSWGMCPLVEAENTLLDEDDLPQRDEREAAEDRNPLLETRLFLFKIYNFRTRKKKT
jgi:hypothetical protein